MPAEPPLRIVIADDEPVARDVLRSMLREMDDIEIVGEAATGEGTVAVVARESPDLLLLDIRMPGLDGFDALAAMGGNRPPAVVFVTAYDEFALRAFDVHALDYLLKPFGDRRLRRVIDRAKEQIRLGRAAAASEGLAILRRREMEDRKDVGEAEHTAAESHPAPGGERIALRRGGRTELVPVADIDWVEGAGDYARLHVGEDDVLARRTLADLSRSLADHGFVRIHRSVVVNVSRVAAHHPISHGDHAVILQDGTRLRASRTYRESFLRRLHGGAS